MCVLQNAHKRLALPSKATNDLDWLQRDVDNEYRIKVSSQSSGQVVWYPW